MPMLCIFASGALCALLLTLAALCLASGLRLYRCDRAWTLFDQRAHALLGGYTA